MKKFLVAIFLLFLLQQISAQNVGIGTLTPKAAMNVGADRTVLFGEDSSGGGSKLIWYPSKSAFRAGFVDPSNQLWNYNNVGIGSFAAGEKTLALGRGSFVAGIDNQAHGTGSFAMGFANIALSGYSSVFGSNNYASAGWATAFGHNNKASGISATAFGESNTASGAVTIAAGNNSEAVGDYSISIGTLNYTNGTASTAIGRDNITFGSSSTALGRNCFTVGQNSAAIGSGLLTISNNEIAIGSYNSNYSPTGNTTDRLLVVGNGYDENNRSDAMVLLKNGNTGFGTSTPQEYGHGGTNKIVEIVNSSASENSQSHLILSSNGTSGALGGVTWAAPNVPNSEKRTGFIGNFFQTGNQTKLSFFTRSNAAALGERFYIEGNGNAWLQGVLTENSDMRLKTNILPINNALSSLLQVNGYTYNWKDGQMDNSLQCGVIAQEVQAVFPHLVKTSAEGTLSVNYSGLIPVMLESIREQQKQIDTLTQLVNKIIGVSK